MKRILSTLTLLLCFAFTAVNAQVITVERAVEIANSFFSAGVQKSGAARGVVASSGLTASFDSNDVTDAASANPTFYVLTNPEGGFVIVSGEETENPIIGYSFDGTIDTSNLPDGFVDYMTDIDAQVKALREYNANNPQKAAARSAMARAANFEYNATTMGEIVVDLKTAPWGQGSPFNKLCPVVSGVNARTGCGPTAFAILCHYYQWPESGSGTYTRNGETIDISTSTYDYASMRNDNYPSGQYTEAEANAVALLMRDLGFAHEVDYGASATEFGEKASVLKSAFSYKSEYNPSGSGMDAMWRTSVGNETFIASLKECLDKERPIPFSSKSIDPETGKGSIRHIFILDGYTKDNYFHFNYGWGGVGNGWYTIDFMQPDEDSDYSTEQRAYLDLIPNRTPRTVTASVSPAGAGTVTVNDNANSAEVTEGTYATLKAIANNGYTFSHWSNGSTDNPLKVKVEAEGNEYVANFLTVGNTTVNVSVSYNSSYGTVTYNSSAVSGTGITPYLNSEVTLVATPLDGYVFNGWTVKKGTNSTPYSGTELTFIATEDMSVEANFSTAIATYNISEATGTLENSTSSRYTTWSSSEVLGLYLTASYNSNAVEAISFYNSQVKLISAISEINKDQTVTYKSPVTYTLSAPDGYVITAYSMTYKSSSSNYNMTVANAQMTQTLANRNEVLTLSATGLSAQNTSFTVSGANTNYAIQVQEFTVTLQSEGGAITPTTYTIYATAGEGGSVTINGDAVSQKSVNENSTVTLVATPQTGYRFVNWTDANNGSEVSTSATYSYTATSNKSLVANFEETDYTVTVAAGEGGVAYIGTKGTTEKTVSHNENVTITAEANNGYRFVEWRAWNNYFSSNAQQDVTVTTDVTYTAVFEAEAQTEQFPDGAYKIHWEHNGRGYLAYYSGRQDEAVLADVTLGTHGSKHYTSTTEGIDLVWYLITADDGQRYLFHAATGKFLGANETANPSDESKANKLSTSEALPIRIEENTACAGHYVIRASVNGEENAILSSGCATASTATPGPVRWWWKNYKLDDGGSPLKLIPVDNVTVADNVMNAVLAVINSTEKTLDVTFGELWSASEVSQIVTKDSPAITITEVNGANKIGYSTKNDGKHPFLLKGGQFTISVPAPYKIASYTLNAECVNFNAGTVEYSNGIQSTTTATIVNGQNMLSASGLNNSEIIINVGNAQAATAGIVVTSLEITYVENELLPFKAEIEGWRNDNPNTHLGTITIGGTAMKLTPEHLNASELTMPLAEGTALAFTRKYRGFEFNGFYIGSTPLGENPTLTADNVAAIDENNPLVAKFTATDDVTLFYDDDTYSYRIPAIAKTGTNRLVAVSDYRHSLDDIGRDKHGTGTNRVDLVMRTSDDNGLTWSEKQTIAEGTSTFGYGDAAIVANGQDILVMAVAGNVFYPNANATNKNKTYRIYSNDNGESWTKEEVTSNIFGLFDEAYATFFGSGKLAVDPNFNGTGNARVYGAILLKNSARSTNNYVLFSDDWGANWKILGGSKTQIAEADEPKVEILPNGQILLSSRHASGGSRIFNVFTYGNDKAAGEGTWGTAVSGCSNGGSNGTNGEIICLDAKRTNGMDTKILLQSQPKGGSNTWDRKDVTIWYKELNEDTYTPSSIASGWNEGLQVSTVQSAYSAMALQENGEIAFFFEEAPCYGDDNTKGYSMVYVPLTIEEITGENFLNPNAVVETVTVDVTLTDEQGNTYTHQFNYLPGDAAAINAALTTAYPFITLGENGNLEQTGEKAYTYTNTVTLPFKVSNANTTVWHNIYWPSYNPVSGKIGCPVYLSATEGDSNVPKVTADAFYGESEYNTLNWADRLSWAVYNVNNSFTFKFKNKLTGKYIQATSVATGNAQNVVYANENNATAFELLPDSYSYVGDYALVAKVGETTGYLCSTSATGYDYATHYFNNSNNGYGHQGAWVKFVEAPDYQAIVDALIADVDNFGAGEGKYTANDAISNINKNALATTPLNTLNTHTETVQNVKDSYREVVLTVNETETSTTPGSVSITVNGSAAETVNNKFVPANATVSILATANPGYRFVNWTRPVAQASAAARTAEARNSNVVSDQNPYTVTVSEALSLEANFEEIVVNATLTDAQGNTYNVQLSGFTTGITTATVAAKLTEKYPCITLGDNATLDNAAYTYSNNVTLPFKVSSLSDATKTYLHNIYYPSNNKKHSGYPNYIAAFNDEDNIVDMAESPDDAYGYNPTYNTMNGNPMISWVVYSVNNSFEFVFKNELTNKYIKVESVVNATGNTKNVKFVDNAGDATAFTLLKDAGSYNGDYALVAKVGDATGYLCATSSSTNYVTHFDKNDHQGAWVKFVEVDYGQYIGVLDTKLRKFDVGDDKHMITAEIQPMIAALYDSGNITKSQFERYFDAIDAMDAENWPKLSLTIAPDNSGTTTIAGEEGVTRKYVPTGDLTIKATPAEGYHFVNWTDGTSEVSTEANYEFNITAATALTANFEKNSYPVSVTAGEGGSATASASPVEHGNEVTLTATPTSTDYSFAGWYNGETKVSDANPYTFTVTSDINYTARFNEEAGETPTTVAIHITVASTDGTTVTNAVGGNVKAVISNIGLEWATGADFVVGADVELVASSDYDQKAYLFDGWYKNDVLVSKELAITVKATEAATYQARFFKGCTVIAEPKSNRIGYVTGITLSDGTSLGYGASNRAVVKKGTEVKINTWLSYGYETTWKDENDVIVGNEQNLVITIEKDVTYTATFEPASYQLTVRANYDERGTVSAESGTSTGTTIKVGHNMEAAITATANDGFYFVNWTKGTDVVSESATYTISGIANVEDMADAEYIANFLPVENATPGTYYRIGYEFPPAADTYSINSNTGVLNNVKSSKYTEWIDNTIDATELSLRATNSDGTPVHAIKKAAGDYYYQFNAYTCDDSNTYSTSTKYTLSVSGNYIIKECSITYKQSVAGQVTISYGDKSDAFNNTSDNTLSLSPNAQTVEFTLTSSSKTSNYYLHIKNFTVTIQPVGGETPEPESEAVRYYVQSEACGVSGKENALIMRSKDDENYNVASSIFYYADSKLLSYDKGLYIKEDGGTRGLQAVGTSGTVTITTSGKTATIAAPSYMHAVDGTTRYVDHCGSNPDNHAANHNFVLEEVESLPVTISAAGYASWYAPVAVELPDEIEAWYFKGDIIKVGDVRYAKMTKINGNVVPAIVPANTGVILKDLNCNGNESNTYELTITTEEPDYADEVKVLNKLEGTVAAQYVNKGKAYVLSKQNGQIGFYRATTAGQQENVFLNNSHKAYLPASNLTGDALQSAGFRFSFGGTTDIEEVETESSEVNAIYDLTGRKLEGISGAGIYIVNGKKVIVR